MFITKKYIDRRTVLRGMGAAVALQQKDRAHLPATRVCAELPPGTY